MENSGDKQFDLGITTPDSDEFFMEYQVESERGFHVMGTTVYTSDTLLPLDPAHFTSINGEPMGKSLMDFEVPDESWVWAWSRWYVDMTADVDDQGWCYSWRFRSNRWSGSHRFMRSFVRQRVWKRPRVKRNSLLGGSMVSLLPRGQNNQPDPVEEERLAQKEQGIIEHIQKFRNDREKVEGIIEYIENNPDEIALLVNIRNQLMGTLSFPVSRKSLITKLSESKNKNCELFILAPSNTWRDQVLQRGEPEQETKSEEKAVAVQGTDALK